MKGFKPNLIPNNPKDGSFDLDATIKAGGGYNNYVIVDKKDGARLQIIEGELLTRALKVPSSHLVNIRFQKLVSLCKKLNIALDGEFYAHGFKFNAIMRFFTKSDVADPKYKAQLEKELKKNPEKFAIDYDGLGIEFLTTFHDELKFWLFDGIVLDRPDLVGYAERMHEILTRIVKSGLDEELFLVLPDFEIADDYEHLTGMFERSLENGYEGKVVVHKDHKYKFGRNTLKEGTILKMKNDDLEYDGVIIDVVEATSVKDGVEKTTNELGRSVTSKKKGDREASGIAKGFVVAFEDDNGQCLGTFTVGLRGFDNETRSEMFANKEKFIGKHFKYTGMPPVKDFPRHAYFKCWRDEK